MGKAQRAHHDRGSRRRRNGNTLRAPCLRGLRLRAQGAATPYRHSVHSVASAALPVAAADGHVAARLCPSYRNVSLERLPFIANDDNRHQSTAPAP